MTNDSQPNQVPPPAPAAPSFVGSDLAHEIPPKKSNKAWLFGGCGCAVLLVLLLLGVLALFYSLGRKAKAEAADAARHRSVNVEPAATNGTSGQSRPGSSNVASARQTYVSTPENIPAALREHFVAFRFDYPSAFKIESSEQNFIKVSENRTTKSGNYTLENFAVGYVEMPSADADNNTFYPELVKQLSAQFASQFIGFREVAQVPETVGGYPGRALVFQAKIGVTPLFGKAILARETSNRHGVCIIMLATPEDPEVKTLADLGVKGDLPGILASFKFVSTTPLAPSAAVTGSYGAKLEFNGGELYYTSAVTEAETRRLGDYLTAGGFFDGTKKTAQLNKSGASYEFRVVAKAGIEKDPKMLKLFRSVAAELSKKVFNGANVVVHLCDDQLRTLKVVTK